MWAEWMRGYDLTITAEDLKKYKNRKRENKMLKVHEFVERKELISKFAKEMARLQKKADRYYYIEKNKEMSDFVLNYATEVKELASKLEICEEMYEEAYRIYDFRKSGQGDYTLSEEQLEELKKWCDVPYEPENF